ncbi:MAG: type VI secretion system-associated protein TagF [Gammaproteobacteria bacterium]|nr:type VI secretion system-associated protein TagF [Gammaproteobacteria bacterium]MCP5425225.1 type VI secretion system-associated protein TagF [Gammaproteobacteria bacterium]MCP5459621.1 type VI secretion system-associated protein TagF [Gammaproteobacteria bacterium]
MPPAAVSPDIGSVGFFGKLPIRGDFISRNLPRSFLDPWDTWLQQAIARSRQQLDARWLDCYLTSPIWCFALSPGACGPSAIAGALMPSMDRVGRYYPLVIAATLPDTPSLLTLLETGQDWFQTAEQTALKALDEEWELEEFATRVTQIGLPPTSPETSVASDAELSRVAWYCPLRHSVEAAGGWSPLAEYLLHHGFPQCTLWWSQGSEHISPSLLICQGLPAIDGFAAMLAGKWRERGWGERPLQGHSRLFTVYAAGDSGLD